MAPAQFTVPFGPVIPILAMIVASGILAGATQAQLIAGAAAIAAGAVLYFLAPKPTDHGRLHRHEGTEYLNTKPLSSTGV